MPVILDTTKLTSSAPDHGLVLFLVLFPITFGIFQQFAKALFFFTIFHGFFKIL